MKKKMKKILAIVSVLLFTVGSVSLGYALPKVGASNGGSSTGITPVYLPGFKNVTLNSFNTAKNVSGTQFGNTLSVDGLNDAGASAAEELRGFLTNMQKEDSVSFDKTLLSMWVDFGAATGSKARIEMAGADGSGDNGIWFTANNNSRFVLHVRKDGDLKTKSIYCSDVGMTASTEKFLLQLSFEYSALDTTDNTRDLKIGVYINGRMFDGDGEGTENKVAFADVPNSILGRRFELYTNGASNGGTTCVLESCVPENRNLSKITWSNFKDQDGMNGMNQTFTSTKEQCQTYKLSNNAISQLASTSFEADVTFHDKGTNSRLYFAGRDAWSGMRFDLSMAGKLYLRTSTAPNMGFPDNLMTFDPALVNMTTFFDTTVRLKITTEYGDYDGDGDNNDAQIGFYFGGKLYNNQYCYVMDYATAKNSSNQVIAGNYIGVYTKEDTRISISFVYATAPTLEQLDDSYDEITFSHFKIQDGSYKKLVDKKTKLDLDKTVLCGKIKFEQGKEYIMDYAKEGNNRLRIAVDATTGRWVLGWYTGDVCEQRLIISRNLVGTGEWLDFMLSMEKVAQDGDGLKNDIKFGFWFDGVLYNNEYFIVKNKAGEIGSKMSISSQTEGATFAVESVAEHVDPIDPEDIVVLNPDFKKTTFDHFSIADGTYTNDGSGQLRATGKARISLDKTVFYGDVFVPENQEVLLIMAGKNAWDGLRFVFNQNGNNGQLNIAWYQDSNAERLANNVDADRANTKLVGEWLNLKVSTEIIDYDKDGQMNDIRLAIWFNDIAYNDEYLILRDKAAELGTYCSVGATKGNSISVRSISELIEPFDFASFGLTDKWTDTLLNTGLEAKIEVGGSRMAAPPTGDNVNIVLPICGIVLGVVGFLSYIILEQKSKKKQ